MLSASNSTAAIPSASTRSAIGSRPDGNVYVLQAHEERFPIDSLAKLGDQLKLPSGWKFRTQDLSEDLILDLKADQTVYAIGDEYHQYWTRIPKSK